MSRIAARHRPAPRRRRAPAPIPIRVPAPRVGVPIYLRRGGAGLGAVDTRFMPDPEEVQGLHSRSLSTLEPGPTHGPGDQELVSRESLEVSPRGLPRQRLTTHVTSAGELGTLDMSETYALDGDANPADVTVRGELPPVRGRSNPYPVQLSFSRTIAYADRKGRIVQAEISLALGFERNHWNQATQFLTLGSNGYNWDRVADIASDRATASVLVDGTGEGEGEGEQGYMTFASAEGSGMSVQALVRALASGGIQGDSLSIQGVARPRSPAGTQFQALQSWLDQVDAERYRKAHPPMRWYERGWATAQGLGTAIYNNTVGAVIEAGKQVWDMGRLGVAAFGKWSGAYSYMPKMTSGVGKAAEQGQGTGDILAGMGKGMVLAPKRAVEAFMAGDYERYGEELGNTGFAIDTLRQAPHTARALASSGRRMVSRGLTELGRWQEAMRAPTVAPRPLQAPGLDVPYGPVHDASFSDLHATVAELNASPFGERLGQADTAGPQVPRDAVNSPRQVRNAAYTDIRNNRPAGWDGSAGLQDQHWTKVLDSTVRVEPGTLPGTVEAINTNRSALQSRTAGESVTLLTTEGVPSTALPSGQRGTRFFVADEPMGRPAIEAEPGVAAQGPEPGALGDMARRQNYTTEHRFADSHLIPRLRQEIQAARARAGLQPLDSVQLAVAAGEQARFMMEGVPSTTLAGQSNAPRSGIVVDLAAPGTAPSTAAPGPLHTSAGRLGPDAAMPAPGTATAGVSTPSTAELSLRDAAHRTWIDALHRAVKGQGPEPPPWRGESPRFDAQGVWRGDNPAQAHAAYRQALDHGGGMFEAILARNRLTGEYLVMLGDRASVAAPANSGVGSWETVAHYHPNPGDAMRYTQAAPHDVWTAMTDTLQHGDGVHVEFVDSVINGKPTRIAIVVDAQGVRIDVGAGAAGPTGPAIGGEVVPVRDLVGGFQAWWSSLSQGHPMPAPGQPGGTTWVPSGSQASRRMLIESAEQLQHPDAAAHVRASAPEHAGVAPAPPRSRADLVNQAPAGSIFHFLKQLNLGPGRISRLTYPPDEATHINSGAGFQIAQGRMELEVLLKAHGTRLLAAYAANGQLLNPTQPLSGQSYTLLLLTRSGQRWLVPGHLVNPGNRP